MKLLIVSALSGAGKSTALDTLEDCGYHCIDNLPINLLADFINHVMLADEKAYQKTAIGINARNQTETLNNFSEHLAFIRSKGITCEIIFLYAEEAVLLRRYTETRRKHPLTSAEISLKEALVIEKAALEPIAQHAHIIINTSCTHYHQLRGLIRAQVDERDLKCVSLQFQSFGFKNGIPLDADFVFDARSLPNPYWIPELRPFTGQDQAIIDYLESQSLVNELFHDIANFIERWLPRFNEEGRSYLTIAIGCTGGQHRSVYLVESLAKHFKKPSFNVIVRHRELNQ